MGIRGELFSTKVALQNRTYFFNVKENRLGDLYLNIVESKNRDEGGFERQSVILFADDLQSFLQGFDESLKVLEKAAREKRRGPPSRGGAARREEGGWTKPREDVPGGERSGGWEPRENRREESRRDFPREGGGNFHDRNRGDGGNFHDRNREGGGGFRGRGREGAAPFRGRPSRDGAPFRSRESREGGPPFRERQSRERSFGGSREGAAPFRGSAGKGEGGRYRPKTFDRRPDYRNDESGGPRHGRTSPPGRDRDGTDRPRKRVIVRKR